MKRVTCEPKKNPGSCRCICRKSCLGCRIHDDVTLYSFVGVACKESWKDRLSRPWSLHLLCVGWRNLPMLRVGWRNFFSSCAVVLCQFLVLARNAGTRSTLFSGRLVWDQAGNSFWCYVSTQCTIQLCGCVSFFLLWRESQFCLNTLQSRST